MDDAAGPYAPAGERAWRMLLSTPIRADMWWQAVGRQSMPVMFGTDDGSASTFRAMAGQSATASTSRQCKQWSGTGRARRTGLYMPAGCLCWQCVAGWVLQQPLHHQVSGAEAGGRCCRAALLPSGHLVLQKRGS